MTEAETMTRDGVIAAPPRTIEEKRAALRRLLAQSMPERTAPLSSSQERLWFLEQLGGLGGAYHLPVLLDFGAGLSVEALEGALEGVVGRHEALRTRFVLEGGVPVQRVSAGLSVRLELFDLVGAADADAQLEALTAEAVSRPFDLEHGPLLRAWLLRRAGTDRLVLVLHHIVSDGWSLDVLVRELHALYAERAGGAPAGLAPLALQYPDYAQWQRDRQASGAQEGDRRWWTEQLAGAPVLLDLPTDEPRPVVERHDGATRSFGISAQVTDRLRALAQARGATLFMVLLAGYAALLARWSGMRDLVIGTPIAGRNRPELEGLIGFFVNMLALRLEAAPDERMGDLIDRVRAVTVGAYEHQELAFEQLVEALQPERSLAYAPVYQVAFALQNLPGGAGQTGAVPQDVSAPMAGSAKFDLTLSLSEAGEGLVAMCEYRTDLFADETIERLCRRYGAVLEAMAADPDIPVAALPMQLAGQAQLPPQGPAAQALGLGAGSRVALAGPELAPLAEALGQVPVGLAEATHLLATPELLAGLATDAIGPDVTIVLVGLPCFAAPLARWRGRRLLGLWAPGGVPVARLALEGREAVIAAALDGHRIEIRDAGGGPQAVDLAGRLFVDDSDSGLVARQHGDGTIRVTGAATRQLRLHGMLGDPDRAAALLRQHPLVAQAGVAVVPGEGGRSARLAAWAVPRPGARLAAEELRDYVAGQLGAGLALDSLTLRDAPAGPDWQPPQRDARPSAPATPLEALLARIWSDVLKSPQTDIDANFFDQGGNSVSSIQVITRIRDATRIDIPLHQLFEAPSIRNLAALIESGHAASLAGQSQDNGDGGAAAALQSPILRAPPGTRRSRAPLSFAQERLWFLDQFQGPSPLYNMAFSLPLPPSTPFALVQRVLDEIVRRHESLRTVFPAMMGSPVQAIAPPRAVPIERVRLSSDLPGQWLEEVMGVEARAAQQPFALDSGPLLRAHWADLGEAGCRLHIVTHHIVFDGWSFERFAAEFRSLLSAFARDLPSPLADLRVQYGDYSRWQRGLAEGGAFADSLAFWRDQLADAPSELELPFDRPRPSRMNHAGALHGFQIDAAIGVRLQALARREGTTLFAVLLTAYQLLLMRLAGQDDIVVGTPVSNRGQIEVEPLIGFFANTLALRLRIEGNPSFLELLRATSRTHLAALGHQQVPFEKLVEEIQPERSLNRNPLFQVMLVLQNLASGGGELRQQMDVAHLGAGERIESSAKFDMTLTAAEIADGLMCTVEYSTELFDHATIERISRRFEQLLDAVVADPDQPALAIDLLTPADREAVAAAEGASPFDPDEIDLGDLIQSAAGRDPDAVALEHGHLRRSYSELVGAAILVQRELTAMGVGKGDRVAIRMPRGIGMAVAVLAVLRVGAVYVPVDADYPKERQRFILANSGARVVIAPPGDTMGREVRHLALAPEGPAPEDIAACAALPKVPVSPGAPAYIIYTSGSTGTPKGVVMPRRALANLVRWDMGAARLSRPRTLQFSPLSFDVSFQEIGSTWALGAPLILVDEPVRRDPDRLWRLLVEAQVERLYLPFVALQQLAEAARRWDGPMPPLRDVISAGEQLVVTDAIIALFERLDGCALRNQYGPTETHIMTEHVLEGRPADWPVLPPIGKPIANCTAHVLDAAMRPTPIGVPGEIFAGGACVATGYHALDERTAERFVPDPFAAEAHARLYCTGDRARRLADGSIQYLGRADRQAKVRGFRIEPGEIEAALVAQPGVAAAAVVVAGQDAESRRLVALIVPGSGVTLAPDAIKAALSAVLPEHMVPTTIMVTDHIPLTPSGKVDRAMALRIAAAGQGAMTEDEAAATPLERMIADLWAELLGVAWLSTEQDFFAAGGHSLLATRALSRIASEIGIDLPVRHIFAAPTARRLAARIVELIAERLQVGDADRLLMRVEQRVAGHSGGA